MSEATDDETTESIGDRHPADLAMLRGARLVVAQESEEGRRWAESRIKALTGGDPITARFMRQDFFTFTPQFKLLIASNHKPALRNVDEAMRRRLHLVPFTVTFDESRRDPDLAEKLKDEWPGILQWAIEGCIAYQREGLRPPLIVRQATDEYFTAQDPFGEWLDEHTEQGATYWETPGRLFESWSHYADGLNEPVGTGKVFADRLESKGFRKSVVRGIRRWNGLRLRDF